jgi:phosphate transport system permease protein
MFKGFWRSGDPFIWLTGGALAFSLIMIISLIVIVAANALGFFWPRELVLARLQDGSEWLGQITGHEQIPSPANEAIRYRTQLQVANRDLYGADFRWIEDEKILERSLPADAIFFERWEWGPLFGFIKTIKDGNTVIAEGPQAGWQKFQEIHPETQERLERIEYIEKKEIGQINYNLEQLRLAMKGLSLRETDASRIAAETAALEQQIKEWQARYEEKTKELQALRQENNRYHIVVQAAGGHEKDMPVAGIVRSFLPNQMSWVGSPTLKAASSRRSLARS